MYHFGDEVEITTGFFKGLRGILYDIISEDSYEKKYLMLADDEDREIEGMEIEIEESKIKKLEEDDKDNDF